MKEPRKLILSAIAIILLLALPLLLVGVGFFRINTILFHRFELVQYISIQETPENHDFINSHLARLVRGEDRRTLESTGFACDNAVHSTVCVSNKHVRVDTMNMTVYIPFDHNDSMRKTTVRPYPKEGYDIKSFSPVDILQYPNNTSPPACQYEHQVPAVIFSSGIVGNVYHELSEIIIPLYLTTKQFESRVLFILEDYKPSFVKKYGKVFSRLSNHKIMNPAENGSIHCFQGSIVGLRYHTYLALNSSEIPGGHSMSDFRIFLRQAFGLKFVHVYQIKRPRLMLLSRSNSRSILNEEKLVSMMEDVGFQVIVVRRSKTAKNLDTFSRLINSCSVLVGTHGAGLTNEIFLPSGAVMVQVELIGTEGQSNGFYGDTARAMGVKYLRYKIEAEESSLSRIYGKNHSFLVDPGMVYFRDGYQTAHTVFLDLQNVRINLVRFRPTLVEAISIVTNMDMR